MKKIVISALTFIILFTSNALRVVAKDDGYNYSYWGESIPSALGLSYTYSFDQFDLGTTFDTPEDMSVHEGKTYIVDSKTNALTILDSNYQLISFTNAFVYEDDLLLFTTLNQPKGIYVNSNYIYIADTMNNRILKLNHNLEVVDEYQKPDDTTFEEVDYQPEKLVVDAAERMYVIAASIYEGIIELNYDGTFNRYTGVNEISINPIDIIWRQIMTDKQLSKMELYLPTEFTNLTTDDMGFIYTTSKPDKNGYSQSMIKAINPKGIDILKRTGYSAPQGDIQYVSIIDEVVEGPSKLVGITVNEYGMYTVLDQKRGRLFTYNNDGYLLYISGDKGTQSGKLQLPVAVSYKGEDLLVLDQKAKSLVVFKLTEFGSLVNQAVEHHFYGRFEESSEVWSEVVKLNSNYEVAYIGIGKSLLRQGHYKEAMDNFILGKDRKYYSKAFDQYRKQVLSDNFTAIMSVISVVSLYFIIRTIRKNIEKAKEER